MSDTKELVEKARRLVAQIDPLLIGGRDAALLNGLADAAETAESEAAALRARVARLEDNDRDWGRLHQRVIEDRAAALLRIERLEEVLRATREAFIVDKAEDGRVQGVSYYSDALRPLIGRLDAALLSAKHEGA